MSDRNTDFRKMGDSSSMFESGDQDYASAAGWEPESELQKLLKERKKKNPRAFAPEPQLFYAREATDWLSMGMKWPPCEQLFGPYWLRDEICILFAATGLGKSALATRIAESLARGLPIPPFDQADAVCLPPQKVLYIDFELSVDQFAMRYSHLAADRSDFSTPYEFSPNFLRSELVWNGQVQDGYDGFSDMFFTSLGNHIDDTEATVLILDNITFLDRTSTSNINTSLCIMRRLNELKKEKLISILVIAHTHKRRHWEPLSSRDLQGSVNLANFADSIFAMAPSRRSPDLRYLKQIKARSGHIEFGDTNVPVFSLEKFDQAAVWKIAQNPERPNTDNFLGMKFSQFDRETEHLGLPPRYVKHPLSKPTTKEGLVESVKDLIAQGNSLRKVAKGLNVPLTTVRRHIKAK